MSNNYQTADAQKLVVARLRASRYASTLIYLGHCAGLGTLAVGCAALAGYALQFEPLWRPLPGGPATHPITAIGLIAGGAAVAMMKPLRIPLASQILLGLVAALGLIRIAEFIFGTSILDQISPFSETLTHAASRGLPIRLGWNTATLFILIPTAFLLRLHGMPRLGQSVAAVGLCASLASLLGYTFGIAQFYSQMSIMTTIGGLFFSASPLLFGARAGLMRAISSPWDGGRYARMEIMLITSIILLTGLWLQNEDTVAAATLLPAFAALTIVIAAATIACFTVIIEKNDHLRRQAERRVNELMLHDPLSGLYNRRFLKEQEAGLLAFAGRQGHQISLVIIDIDHFKSVNDRFGHPIGDAVIKRVAGEIKDNIRRSDLAVRYGGEELLVVLLDACLEDATAVAEDLRRMVEEIDFSECGFSTVTVSIGTAEVRADLAEAIGRADKALYRAKQTGRNRVVADDTPLGPVLVEAGSMSRSAQEIRLQALNRA